MRGNHPFSCLVKQLVVIIREILRLKSLGYQIVVSKPHDTKRQQKRILVPSTVAQFLKQKNSDVIFHFEFLSKYAKTKCVNCLNGNRVNDKIQAGGWWEKSTSKYTAKKPKIFGNLENFPVCCNLLTSCKKKLVNFIKSQVKIWPNWCQLHAEMLQLTIC